MRAVLKSNDHLLYSSFMYIIFNQEAFSSLQKVSKLPCHSFNMYSLFFSLLKYEQKGWWTDEIPTFVTSTAYQNNLKPLDRETKDCHSTMSLIRRRKSKECRFQQRKKLKYETQNNLNSVWIYSCCCVLEVIVQL